MAFRRLHIALAKKLHFVSTQTLSYSRARPSPSSSQPNGAFLKFNYPAYRWTRFNGERIKVGMLAIPVAGAGAVLLFDSDDTTVLCLDSFDENKVGMYFPPQIVDLVSSRNFSVDINLSKDSRGSFGDGGCKCGSGCLGRNSIARAAATVSASVVNISVTQGFHGMFLGKSIGSGTIINSDGTILTCAHVVADSQSMRTIPRGKVEVTLQDGRTFEGQVLNADFHSDIAIVKIKSRTPLPAANLGSSTGLRPGDWVVAMGCPLSLQNTVTAGIVSCVDRKSSDLGLGGIRREYLQTDCAINEGNSGGPLVNLDGEVVGVNTMKIAAADGLSFAVPIDSVTKIIEQFKKSGKVIRPWLGLKMLELNEMIIMQLKERDITFPDVRKGVLVPMVTPGSPADHAGFRQGDVVVEFAGRPVGTVQEIIDLMGDKVGVPLKVLVKRSGNVTVTLDVVAEEAPNR